LQFSLGMPPALDGAEPEFVNALKKIIDTGKKLGKVVGTMGIGENVARKRASEGMDFLLASFDQGAMMTGMAQDVAAAQKGASKL
jgi:2-keto-3-deoxy-L-rhamnonate aldolase RhmA